MLLCMFLLVLLFFEVFCLLGFFFVGFLFCLLSYEITNIVIIMISKHFTIGHGKRSMFLF